MAHLNTISTSNVSQGTWQCRNGKTVSSSRKGNKTHRTRAHRSFFKKFAILFAVACILLMHPDDFETQEQHVAKVHNRVSRSLAKVKSLSSENGLELHPMEFEHYDDAPPTYEGTYEGAYNDVDEPYAEAYEFPPKRVYSRNQWTTPKKRCYRDGPGTILKERKIVEYEIPQQVHYERKWKIEHDAREEEVDSNETLSADVAVSASVEKSSTSVSKLGAEEPLPSSPQNKAQSAKMAQEPKGSSGAGTSASTGSIGSTKHGKQNKAVNIKTGRGFSRRQLATYITYRYCKFFVAAIVVRVYSVCCHFCYSGAATESAGKNAEESFESTKLRPKEYHKAQLLRKNQR
ncbi:hypothetical protein AK88_05257 [Plasmodium fragile]|uniref:Uncharacterized protein n=1 Tax=Plasmodium fragile TaxID=5857 RepID=A0A0D9QDJ4_PLAFR|nr:uncharacterized protein AK88_05257 [Plasmodium fragile]KJP85105.1 hypothetical protein AK88_05257 [Plasmodium fragile]